MNENTAVDKEDGKSHVKRTAQEKEALVKEYRASGLSLKAFAEGRGVADSSLAYWVKKRDMGRFAEVKVAMPAQMPVEVELRNGIRIRVCCEGKRLGLAELIRDAARC